ncbi:MAG: hypothetical protein Q7S65_04855 [Nanoarchaeota archaeon]|nr:hypothetical protein [Nanoarchaeota archaeon]
MALDKETLDSLARLDPESRLRRLKQLEEERKKETEESENLRKRAEAELKRTQDIPKMQVPTLEPKDISKMFAAEEGLEGIAQRAPPKKEKEEGGVKYMQSAEQGGASDDYRGMLAGQPQQGQPYKNDNMPPDYRSLDDEAHVSVQPLARHQRMYHQH